MRTLTGTAAFRLAGHVRLGIPQRLLNVDRTHGRVAEIPDMQVGPLYDQLVGYVVQEVWDEDTQQNWRTPVGTLFFVEHSVGPGAGVMRYAVTCRHVIEAMKRDRAKEAFIRINMSSGLAQDFPTRIESWVLGDDSDVAVIEFDLPPERHFWAYPIERPHYGLMAGMNLFFIGMFCLIPGTISVRAIVRTGTVAKSIAGVPLCFKADPKEVTESTVHLAEMRSWGGESGSPVFICDDRYPAETQYAFDPGYGPGHEHRPWLLGLLHGQFEMPRIVTKRQKEQGSTFENTGIGIVVPVAAINDVLHYPIFVDSRARAFKTRTELAKRNLPK